MIDARRLLSNAATSVLHSLVSGLTLFILYRYLIQQLGTEQLGLWSVILASTAVARLSDLGLTGSVVKYVARHHALQDAEKVSAVVQTASISVALLMGALLAFAYPFITLVLTWTIPPSELPQAREILPWALLSLWLNSIGAVFLSGLDGCHRMAMRNVLMIGANLLYFSAAFWLVPHYGLIGLAIGQAIQGLVLLVASWLVLRRFVTCLPLVPCGWSRDTLREILGYALSFQINSLSILLFEPAAKLLMTKFGGLSTAAYYEMASQLVVKLRALLISANQALVPTVAHLQETTPEALPNLYLRTLRVVVFLAVPFFSTVLIALPAISYLWIGRFETQFLHFGALLVVAWGINTATGPAYFFNLGTGNVKWNTASHVLSAIVNVVLGSVLGRALGGAGVGIGVATALIASSAFLVIGFHRTHHISLKDLFPASHGPLLLLVICYPVGFVIISAGFGKSDQIISSAVGLALYAVVVGGAAWFHPYRQSLLNIRLFK